MWGHACKSDVQYGNWWDEQICQENEGIAQWDKGINDYANIRKPCKALWQNRSSPSLHRRACGVFKPLDTTANPLESVPLLSHWSRSFEGYLRSDSLWLAFTGLSAYWKRPKTMGMAFYHSHIWRRQCDTTGTFERTSFASTLCHTSPYSPLMRLRWARKPGYPGCPICTYIVKNDSAFLNHISHLSLLEQLCMWKMPRVHRIIRPADEEALFEVLTASRMHARRQICRGSKLSKLQGSGEPSSKPLRKDNGDQRSNEEKGNKPHGLESKALAKWPLRSMSKRACITVGALLGPVQKAGNIRVTTSW